VVVQAIFAPPPDQLLHVKGRRRGERGKKRVNSFFEEIDFSNGVAS
jgi:hypothetical protein